MADEQKTLKEIVRDDIHLYLTGSAERSLTAENLALHTGAPWWSAASMLTGDYIALGGYDGAYQHLEMGLAALKEKYGVHRDPEHHISSIRK